jgi:serine/threonine protein kinase/Flp pilus assembly protein TadD
MPDPSSSSGRLDELAEEFAQRHERGEHPSISEYADRYPDLADQIRDLFPALLLMQEIRPEPGAATGPFESAQEPVNGRRPERLGDYRILREVGRGGMGIVYEAEQESLGRHVALKLLPSHALLDSQRLRRFQREARAAARLHHTNIVPVYGVGAHEGVHYYVMQFIQGLGLDEVLTELQKLRAARAPSTARARGPARLDRSGPMTASNIAQGMLSGDFAAGREQFLASRERERPEEMNRDAALASRERERPEDPPVAHAPGSPKEAPGSPKSDSSIHLPGQAPHSTLSESGQQYWQSVARIGVQVAQALAYAHAQGTLHRDIKPSNLLLDTQGTVWVTDFGLAKASGAEDLTHTGDIVGTLRYMAPERFEGKSDARGDLYSLGLTLYELLTFRPAFDETDRGKLVHRVTHEEPPPRRLNPEVPRDLETIILKAIAREPAHRYQAAAELAADLQRFLDFKPIHARRVSPAERFWRWCRRNPAVASLLALVVVVFLIGFAGVTWKWQEAERLREDESTARREADQARQAADTARKLANSRAVQSRRELQSLAEANRLSSAAGEEIEGGHWQKALRALSRAVRERPDLPHVWQARAEFYKRFCLWDLAAADQARAYGLQGPTASKIWFDHVVLRFAVGDESGYRRACRWIEKEWQSTPDSIWFHRIAVGSLLVKTPVLPPSRLVQIAMAPPAVPQGAAGAYWDLALAHFRAGNYEAALRSALQFQKLQISWEKPLQFSLLAMIQHQLGQAEAARQSLAQAEAALDGWIVSLMNGQLGELPDEWWPILVGPHFVAEAKALIQGSRPPEDPRWWAIRGRSLAVLGRTRQAAAEFGRAVAAKPRDLSIRLAHFRFLVDQGQWHRAEKTLAAAVALKPDSADVWMDGFRAYAEKGQRARADAALDQAAKTGRDILDIWQRGFKIYAHQGNWEAARALHARACALRPEDTAVRLMVVAFHAERESWGKADAEYTRLAARRPADAQLRAAYANFLIGHYRGYDKAAEVLAEAIRLKPDDDILRNLAGLCAYRRGDFAKAVTSFREAIRLKPSSDVYHANRGSAHAELGQWPEAAEDYRRARDLDRRNLHHHRELALCLLSAGRIRDYRQACAGFLQMAEDSDVGQYVAYACLVCTLAPDTLSDRARVLRLLARYEKGNQGNAFFLDLVGQANYRAGKFAEALDMLTHAVRVRGKSTPTEDLFLALTHHQLGLRDSARTHLQKAVRALERSIGKAPGGAATGPSPGFLDRQAGALLRGEVEGILNAPHRQEAEEHVRNKEWARAIPHCDKLIEANARFQPDLVLRGYCFAELGELKKAHADFAAAVALRPALASQGWVYSCYNLLCLELGDEEGCRRTCADLVERYGNSKKVSDLLQLAWNCCLPESKVDRARVVEWLKKFHAANPTAVPSELAVALFRAGRHREALQNFRRIADAPGWNTNPAHLDLHLAMVHHHLGHAAQARKLVGRALEWVERFAETGVLPFGWSEPPKWSARLEFKRLGREAVTLIQPPPPSAVGRCMRQRQWARAITHLDRRLAANPDSVLDFYTRALCHIELKQWDHAAADFAALGRLEPDKVQYLVLQSAARLAAGKHAEHRRLCTSMLERFGTWEGQGTLDNFAYACVRTPDAVADHGALLEVARRVSGFYDGANRIVGAALYRAGHHAEAVRELEESVLVSHRAWDWLFLSMAHQRLGHSRQARAYLDRARRWVREAEGRPLGWGVAWAWWGERIEVETLMREAENLLRPDSRRNKSNPGG